MARCGLALLLLLLSNLSWAASSIAPEYQVKAVFLFNFTQFIEWPAEAFGAADSPIVIGVLGLDPFGGYLDETVGGETIGGRTLQVRRYASVEDIKECHVLFVSHSEIGHIDQILTTLKGHSILTVSDIDDFAKRGGVVGFVTVGNKIRLRINLETAKAANLTISSKLLRPAEIVASAPE